MNGFMGYERADGSFGARNHVAVIPSVACANGVVAMIAERTAGSVPLLHGHGCARAGRDLELHFRTLANLGRNPNVGAALVVGLGCELLRAEPLAEAIGLSGKPVEYLEIQAEGGSRRTTDKGVEKVKAMLAGLRGQERKTVSFEHLKLGLECGGSDAFSGLTANPAVGLVADWLVSEGGTVLLTENTEMIGTSHILQRRSACPEVACDVDAMIERAGARAEEILGPLASMVIAPGNMDGGMSSIQEKSLGCITKGGTSEVTQVVDYSDIPTSKGLVLMDGPGYDMESMAGVAASGCQAILFTTGRGNPMGFPIVPVIKIASTTRLYDSMRDDIDVNAGAILEGKTLEELSKEIIGLLERVLGGEPSKAEVNKQNGILCLYTTNPSF